MNGEEESESVTEAKTQRQDKRLNVLEAIARYNLKKQQDKELAEKSGGGSLKKEKSIDKDNAIKTSSPNSSQIPSETDLGMLEYICKQKGFCAIVKQRYSDFHVNEIDLNGLVVKLTDQTIPAKLVEEDVPAAIDCSLLSPEQWSEIEKVMNDEVEVIEIEVTEKDKEERAAIHKVLRQKYDRIVSNTKVKDGKAVMEVLKLKKGAREARSNKRKGPAYTKFVLYKENLSTMEAVGAIASRLRVKPAFFQYAGTKDKRGKTSQWVTVSFVEPERLARVVQHDKRIAIGNFSYQKSPLQLGDLKGNYFQIVLRNVEGEPQLIQEKLESLKTFGFINYYGSQRFGTRSVRTHHIGKELLLGNWKEAIDLILTSSSVANGRNDDLSQALDEWMSSKDAEKAVSKLRKNNRTIEGQLLFNLKKQKNNFLGALEALPRNLRLTYIHAYQSYVWNVVVSKRIAKYGLKPVQGDLVLSEAEEAPELIEEAEECDVQEKQTKPKPIILDGDNVANFTIYDVVLPLPGYDIIYPSNEASIWYKDILNDSGFGESGLKQKVKSYSLGGAYRRIISKPKDLKWKLVHYSDPTLSLISSDWDRLQGIDAHLGDEDGEYVGLIMKFSLPASSYATMALREITKMDMSSQFQSTLQEAASRKEEPPIKRFKEDNQ